jgi:hypothetical protein
MESILNKIIAFYKFEDNGLDSKNSNHSIVVNNITYANAKIKKGAFFNSADSLFRIPENIYSSAMSFSFWTKITTPGRYMFFAKTNLENPYTDVCYLFLDSNNNNKLQFLVGSGNGNSFQYFDYIFEYNTDLFITFTIKSDYAYLYINGVLVDTKYTGLSLNSQNAKFFVGGLSNGGSGVILPLQNGYIDEFCIYNDSLSETELTYLYNNGNGVDLLCGDNSSDFFLLL